MNRILVIVALTGFFYSLNFPALAMAQSPASQSEQVEETVNVKNVASLTTTDLLNSQDFVSQVTDLPTKRSRTVNPVKGVKSGLGVKPLRLDEEGLKADKTTTASKNISVAASTDMMQPAVMSTKLKAESDAGTTEATASIPGRVSTGNQQVDELIARSAARNGVDQRLLYAMMKQESSFNSRAVSYKGARGLMQLMPATAGRFGVTDIYDPAQNIEGGTRYLRFLLDTFGGDVELALAGYNAGENAVVRYGNRIPPYRETQDYVRKISAHYAQLQNGNEVRRLASSPTMIGKKAEMGILTTGHTMTQY